MWNIDGENKEPWVRLGTLSSLRYLSIRYFRQSFRKSVFFAYMYFRSICSTREGEKQKPLHVIIVIPDISCLLRKSLQDILNKGYPQWRLLSILKYYILFYFSILWAIKFFIFFRISREERAKEDHNNFPFSFQSMHF